MRFKCSSVFLFYLKLYRPDEMLWNNFYENDF